MRIEKDAVEILTGVRFGATLGSPLGPPGEKPRLGELDGAHAGGARRAGPAAGTRAPGPDTRTSPVR